MVIVPPFTVPPSVVATLNTLKFGANEVAITPELGSIFMLPPLMLNVPPAKVIFPLMLKVPPVWVKVAPVW